MVRLSPRQRAWRGRLETALRLGGPALDLVVVGAERVARTGARVERALSRRPTGSAGGPR